MGKYGVGCYTTVKLDGHWINAGICPARRTLSVYGAVGCPQLAWTIVYLHDDWTIC